MKLKSDIETNIKEYIIYSIGSKSDKLVRDINKNKDMHAFLLTIEYYRRDSDSLAKKLMYPGHVFVKTDYNQQDFDEYLYNTFKTKDEGIIRQLKLKETTCLSKAKQNYLNLLFDGWEEYLECHMQ